MERVRNTMKKELLKGLSEEQIAKVKACKSHEELLALAEQEGIELTAEQLEVVSGGGACSVISDVGDKINPWDCPKCGANGPIKDGKELTCKKCGYVWTDNSSPF